MAENAANFTFTYQNKPSIFEVVAQNSLNETLHPGLQKIALFLATNFPGKFSWLNGHYEETFLALNALLQYYYLKYYDSSFSENFYGLKRVLGNNEVLTNHHREVSFVLLVIVPYFKRKLEEKMTDIRIEHAEGYLRQDFEGKMKKFVLILHSTCELIYGLISVQNFIMYMSGQTVYQSPILRAIDVKLTHDIESKDDGEGFWNSIFRGHFNLQLLGFNVIRNAITNSLEVGAFFMQFLNVWNQQQSNYSVTDLPTVDPPTIDNKFKVYQGKCPICLKSWAIPTVLQVSGYIFCFRCILRYLSEHQKCPVTNLPAKPLDIVRLYIN